MLTLDDYLLKLEQRLMVGSGRWIADFTESFRDVQIGKNTFDMLIRGGMRPKGFLLSRIFSVMSMPAHQVACLVCAASNQQLNKLGSLIAAVERYMEEQEISWSWLVLTREGALPKKAKALVEKNDIHEIGIALLDLNSQELATSCSFVGRRMGRYVGGFK